MSETAKFPECRICINREFDPFQCDSCENGSNLETQEVNDQENDTEEMTITEFIDIMRDEHGW